MERSVDRIHSADRLVVVSMSVFDPVESGTVSSALWNATEQHARLAVTGGGETSSRCSPGFRAGGMGSCFPCWNSRSRSHCRGNRGGDSRLLRRRPRAPTASRLPHNIRRLATETAQTDCRESVPTARGRRSNRRPASENHESGVPSTTAGTAGDSRLDSHRRPLCLFRSAGRSATRASRKPYIAIRNRVSTDRVSPARQVSETENGRDPAVYSASTRCALYSRTNSRKLSNSCLASQAA
jgi:hypothetical protein